MNVLGIIREGIERLASTPSYTGLMAVAMHLEVADEHFLRAREGSGDHLYTDALLRCNRALHGMLREAYGLLERAEGPPHPFEVERYFRQNGVLGDRGAERLRAYLDTWRDPSIIDQQLVPGEQDALLALLDLSALFTIVLDRIAEVQAYRHEKDRVEAAPPGGAEATTLSERLIHLLKAFGHSLPEAEAAKLSEPQLQGRLRGFLETVMPGTSLMHDPPLKSPSGVLKPNFILAEGDDSVILEVRSVADLGGDALRRERRRVTTQMMMYLLVSEIPRGVAVLLPRNPGGLAVEQASVRLNGRIHTIATLLPEQHPS